MITESMVEGVWQEVAQYSAFQAHKEMMKLGQRQPNLLAFMTEFSQDLDQEVQELAIYVFFVICRMFEKGSGKKIKTISAEEIEACWEQNEKLMERLEGAHEKFFERTAVVQTSRQPYVMKYLTEALIESPEGEDPLTLSDEDIGYLFLVLKTVVDVLDKRTDSEKQKR